jgi:hypothetical protein
MRELPIIPCVRHILNSLAKYRHQAVRIALPWILALAALNAAELLLYPPDPTTSALRLNPVLAMSAALGVIATASISVNWHRYILRDEVPLPNQLFRLDALVLKYAALLVLVLLMVLLPAIFIASLAITLSPALSFIAPVAAIAALLLATRLMLALPATALGRTDFGIGAAFKATEGNSWRIAGVLAITITLTLGVLLAVGIILSVAQQFGTGAAVLAALITGIPANMFLTMLTASQLNSLYGFFVEGRNF